MKRLIDNIDNPQDLKRLPVKRLPQLADEIRSMIIDIVSNQGGHLASSLGAVELTIALHYLLDTPQDRIIWDVGHQSYAHKILTKRRDRFNTLRQLGGLSGFPSRNESEYDTFTVGHSSTSISTALGLASGRDLMKMDHKIAVVIGDAALAGGMSFEALNHLGHLKKDMIIVLNDNEISISRTIGALSKYLNGILTNPFYNKMRRQGQSVLKKIPRVGKKALEAAKRFEEGLKNLFVPGILFEELGIRYFGPIDGHDIKTIVKTLKNILTFNEPVMLHILTKKGKGYQYAEEHPELFHSAGPFNKETGEMKKASPTTFTASFGRKIVELARKNKKITAITAAMPDGTGLTSFAKEFPNRFIDTGIAEGHAVGLAAGLAKAGMKPVVAIYSTFLQRAYDQIIHDVSLQGLPVLFCLDRSGLVGEDGPTHHGIFDIAYLRSIPNLTVMAPSSPRELETMLEFAVKHNGPLCIRYPKGTARLERKPSRIEFGRSEILKKGKDIAILALGNMVDVALDAAEILKKDHIDVEVINVRFIKPLDKDLLEDLFSRIKKVVTMEEGVLNGGFGSRVAEFIKREKIKGITLEMVGLPDEFVEHGERKILLNKYNLSSEGITNLIRSELL